MKSVEKEGAKEGLSTAKEQKKPSKSALIIRSINARSPAGSLAFKREKNTQLNHIGGKQNGKTNKAKK